MSEVISVAICNFAMRLIDFADEAALGSKTHSAGEVRISNMMHAPANLLAEMACQLASGALTFEFFLSNEDGPNLGGSPDATFALSGTKWELFALPFSDDKRYLTIRTTAGGSGAVLSKTKLTVGDAFPVVDGQPQVGGQAAPYAFGSISQVAGHTPVNFAAV